MARTRHQATTAALTARIFMSGDDQAVHIPAEFRLDTDWVEIRRTPEGDLVLHPAPRQRGAALLAALDGFDAEFIAQLEADQATALPMQDREAL